MFHRIVVPLDGSDFSRAALPYALVLAAGPEATVQLVWSFDSLAALSGAGYASTDLSAGVPGFAGPTDVPGVANDFLDEARAGREKELSAIAADLQAQTGAAVRWKVLEGEPSEAVADEVEESGADAVVMSTHGRGGIERAWLGSVADRLVRRVPGPVPLLLVRPAAETPGEGASSAPIAIRRILVPLDGSPLAEAVFDPAARTAQRLGAALVLARVTGPAPMVGSPYIPHAAEEQEKHFTEQRRKAGEYLNEVAERLRADGVDVADLEVHGGSPASTILELARESAQMVAMATHGRGGLRRWVLGSVSDKVLRGADMPVLLVRPVDDDD